jgi:quercetin dioxygenase-like cupin family protein
MITSYKSAKITEPAPGIARRVLANSPEIMLTEHTLQKGSILPEHRHSNIQLVYVVSGQFVIEMNGNNFTAVKGDSFVIPSSSAHKVTALADSVVLDIFTPARQDYL